MTEQTIDIEVTCGENKSMETVRTAAITLLAHEDNIRLKLVDSDIREITPLDTLHYALTMNHEDWVNLRESPQFQIAYHIIFPGMELPSYISVASLAEQHVVGLIMLMSLAITQNKRPFLRVPESYMHSATQSRLADFIVRFQNGTAFKEIDNDPKSRSESSSGNFEGTDS